MAKTIVYCLLLTILCILTDANEERKRTKIVNHHHYKLPSSYVSHEPSTSSMSSVPSSSSSSSTSSTEPKSSTSTSFTAPSSIPPSTSSSTLNKYPSFNGSNRYLNNGSILNRINSVKENTNENPYFVRKNSSPLDNQTSFQQNSLSSPSNTKQNALAYPGNGLRRSISSPSEFTEKYSENERDSLHQNGPSVENYLKTSRIPKMNSDTYPSIDQVFSKNDAQQSSLNEMMRKMFGNMRNSFSINDSDGDNSSRTINLDNMGSAGQGFMNMGTLQNQPSGNGKNKNVFISTVVIRTCCSRGKCRTLKEGEKCNNLGESTNVQNDEQQSMLMDQMAGKPNFMFGNGGLNTAASERFVNQNLKPSGQMPLSSSMGSNNNGAGVQTPSKQSSSQFSPMKYDYKKGFFTADDLNNDAGVQTIIDKKPSNSPITPMRYTQRFSDFGGLGMNSYTKMPEKKKPTSHPYVTPIGFTEKQAKDIRNQVLERSNMYRQKYGIAPLIMDEQMNNYAQDWANKVTKMPTPDHRPMAEKIYGENIFGTSRLENLGEAAVDSWYGEIIDYPVDDDENTLSGYDKIFHLTQLLWIGSKKMGVGISKSPDNSYNVVVNYDPSGNMSQSFKENLPNITQEDIDEGDKIVKDLEAKNKEWHTEWTSESSPKTTYYSHSMPSYSYGRPLY